MASLIGLLVIVLVAWRIASKEQRIKVLQTIDAILAVAAEHGREDLRRFHAARRARMRWAIVTSALAALNVAIFVWAPKGQPGLTVPGIDSLPWGASFGPLTSNGQWWRLLTAIFVNSRFLLLLVNVVALVQVGLTLERLVGPAAFGTVFFAAGIFSGLAALSAHPMAAMAGPAGAIWGLYGALLVAGVTLWRRRSEATLPLAEIERMGAVAVVFAMANLLDAAAGGAAQLCGLATGIFLGVAITRDVATAAVPPRRAAVAGGVVLAIAIAWALPLRGVLDIRPEIDRIVDVEQKTAATYVAANDQFRRGRMTAETLADLIDQAIVPALGVAAARLETLHGVPREDAPRIADAREFLSMRRESWRLRAQALRLTAQSVKGAAKLDADSDVTFRQRVQTQYTTMLMANGKADGAESASLAALHRLQQPPHPTDR